MGGVPFIPDSPVSHAFSLPGWQYATGRLAEVQRPPAGARRGGGYGHEVAVFKVAAHAAVRELDRLGAVLGQLQYIELNDGDETGWPFTRSSRLMS